MRHQNNPLGLTVQKPDRGPEWFETRGRPEKPFPIDHIRDLGMEDMAKFADPVPGRNPAPAITRLRHTHHTAARLIADGKRVNEVAFLCGYTPQRVAQLLQDPAFQELVAHYHAQVHEVYLDVHKRLAEVGLDALGLLQERMEEAPDSVKTRELIDIMNSTMDRSVAPVKSLPQAPGGGSGAPAIQITFVQPEGAPAPAVTIEGKVEPEG